jgi:hypothetical protein
MLIPILKWCLIYMHSILSVLSFSISDVLIKNFQYNPLESFSSDGLHIKCNSKLTDEEQILLLKLDMFSHKTVG